MSNIKDPTNYRHYEPGISLDLPNAVPLDLDYIDAIEIIAQKEWRSKAMDICVALAKSHPQIFKTLYDRVCSAEFHATMGVSKRSTQENWPPLLGELFVKRICMLLDKDRKDGKFSFSGKVEAIKLLRDVLSCTLLEAKQMMDNVVIDGSPALSNSKLQAYVQQIRYAWAHTRMSHHEFLQKYNESLR